MAVPKVSKMVTACQSKLARLESFVLTHRQTLVDALAKAFQQDLDEGRTAIGLVGVIDGLLARLRRIVQELLDAETNHLGELADDGQYRDERDQAAAALREMLFDLRDLFRASFGKRKAQEAGFERRIMQHPLALLRQAKHVLDRLRDRGLELPPARFASCGVSRAKVIEVLEPAARRLRLAIDHVGRETAQAQETLAAKQQAMASFGDTCAALVKVLEAACRLAGRRDLLLKQCRPYRSARPGSAAS